MIIILIAIALTFVYFLPFASAVLAGIIAALFAINKLVKYFKDSPSLPTDIIVLTLYGVFASYCIINQ